jgi:hypothetical protein
VVEKVDKKARLLSLRNDGLSVIVIRREPPVASRLTAASHRCDSLLPREEMIR